MITLKEIISIVLVLVVLAFSNAYLDSSHFLNSLWMFAIILVFFVGGKKLMAYYYEAEEETQIWGFRRYGLYARSYMKKAFPIGIVLPFLLTIISQGYLKWFAVLMSDIKPSEIRGVRRHGVLSYSEMTEWHLGVIASAGIVACFFVALLGYLVNLPELSRLAIYYATFNLIPIGGLDGTKIFFAATETIAGVKISLMWVILVILDLIGLGYAFFL